MTVLRLMASRHSAFYSPLLGTIAGGFLQEEGFEPVYTPLPPGQTVAQLLTAGAIDVAQSAVSSRQISTCSEASAAAGRRGG